jgi:hypothetical protein
MIVTDHFIYLHLHKTGGSFVNEFLQRFLPDARQVGYHLPRRLAPPSTAHLPALGFVRNPWSYYVSWHTFQVRRPQPNALFLILSEDGRLDFEHTVANLLELGTSSGPRLDRIVAALPQRYTNAGLNLPGFALEPIRGSGRGFYSYLYWYLYDGPGVMHVRRLDKLREELPGMLMAAGQPVSGAMREYLREAPAANTSAHAAYTEYYGASLRDLVAERDADIISRHGFQFGD